MSPEPSYKISLRFENLCFLTQWRLENPFRRSSNLHLEPLFASLASSTITSMVVSPTPTLPQSCFPLAHLLLRSAKRPKFLSPQRDPSVMFLGRDPNTDLLPPPTPRPISREEVEAVLKLLNDVSSVLNDFPRTTGVNVLPVNSSDGSLDEEGVRLLNSSDGSLDEEGVIDILVGVAWRNRMIIGEIVEIADHTFRRSKYEMDRLNGLIAEVPCYGFEWMCTLFGWKFSCELKGGKSRVTDRRWETCAFSLDDYGLPELLALEKDFYYLENIKCVEDGVRYCLGSSGAWAKYLEVLETFKARLKGLVAALEGLDRERKIENKLFHFY